MKRTLHHRGRTAFTVALAALSVAAWSLAGGTASAQWGDLMGKFVYDGKRPEPPKINVNKDVETFGKLGLVDESLLVDSAGGIANVVIYVRTKGVKVNPEVEEATPPTVTYDNKGGKFVPRVATIWFKKQQLVLSNSDPVGHNSNLQPLNDDAINPLLAAGQKVPFKFNRQQNVPVPVGCNIHPWMRGYILPRDNPYMAVTEPDGTFKIEKLPAGELEFQAWQERAGYLPAMKGWDKGKFKVTIKDGGVVDLGVIKVDPKLFKN
jgi:hypothetical protein